MESVSQNSNSSNLMLKLPPHCSAMCIDRENICIPIRKGTRRRNNDHQDLVEWSTSLSHHSDVQQHLIFPDTLPFLGCLTVTQRFTSLYISFLGSHSLISYFHNYPAYTPHLWTTVGYFSLAFQSLPLS